MADNNITLLQKLASAIDGHAATATFACGGSLPVLDLSTGRSGPDKQSLVPSVTIRWDPKKSYTTQSKVTFPLADHDDVSCQMFNNLLHHCDPATFGVGGRDVLDEEYRKAAKLNASDFSTNFHPHDCGIMDSIQQILLPSTIKGGQGIGIGPQGVRAELYKLNIYSAPSGKFRSHVDTPRGVLQFGSLVVCLPCQHEGGVLRVKHRGETVNFEWGHTSQQSVQWAAFYGDCEHEVLEVTKGHRITLTYNLYYSSIGNLAQPVSNPHRLPLFDIAREMLLQPQFLRQGGIIGFFCHHQYAHSQQSGRKSIPGAFKGVDLAVYSVFTALGLNVGIHPIIENEKDEFGGISAKKLLRIITAPKQGDIVENYPRCDSPEYDEENRVSDEYDSEDEDDMDEDYVSEQEYRTFVGTKFHGPTFTETYEEDHAVTNAWPHRKVAAINWMNECRHKDFAYAALAYGNEASLSYSFSAAAILVVVPPSSQRSTTPASHPHGGAIPTTSASSGTMPADSQSVDANLGSNYAKLESASVHGPREG